MDAGQESSAERFNQLKEMYIKEDMGACFANLHLKIEGEMRLLTNEVESLKSRTEQIERYATYSEHTFKTKWP